MSEPNILVLSCGTRNKIIQYFKAAFKGIGNVIAADMSKLAPALYEADKYYITPYILSKGYLDSIENICRIENIKGVLSLIDPELEILAQNNDFFETMGVKVVGSPLEVCERSMDKLAMFNWLQEKGYNCAKTFGNWEEFEAADIEYPVFIKPQKGSASISVNKAEDSKVASFLFEEKENLIIQEYMDGQEIGVDVYIDLINGEVVSMFAKKKLQMRAGETDKSMSFIDEKLFELVKTFVLEAGYRGPIDLDLFEIDGEYYISEVNPRFGGGYPHAYECGVDFMSLIYRNLKGLENKIKIGCYQENLYMLKFSDILIVK